MPIWDYLRLANYQLESWEIDDDGNTIYYYRRLGSDEILPVIEL